MKMLPRTGLVRVLIVSLLVGACAVVSGQETAEADKGADDVLQAVSDYYAGLDNFSADVALSMDSEKGGRKRQIAWSASMVFARPNRVVVTRKVKGRDHALVCDGKKLTVFFEHTTGEKQYLVSDVPENLSGLLGRWVDFLPSLIAKNPKSEMLRDRKGSSLLGAAELAGVKCRRVRLPGKLVDIDLWVSEGEKPLVRQVAQDISRVYARRGITGIKATVTLRFDNWQVNAKLPRDKFTFEPPEGAVKVEKFARRARISPVGRPAPDFELDLLDGGKMRLSDHKDKQIVILDFWGTRCGPCRIAMPALAQVAEAYRDKGVVLYAVSQGDWPDDIRDFLKEQKLKITVALDDYSDAHELFEPEGIPHTVIVGRDGVVEVEHIGIPRAGSRAEAQKKLKKNLEKELDALVAGKSLTGGRKGK